ncbi:3-isopropylmalate dehydratase large subunit [Leptospira sp. GIMC2001]|uniref:3-isopropylmalate dehydratase large subunit n=1 Tax=Leptospira sp. GIMC2001 TaxID=1513297 RepID=UPI00234B48EF|nr:3-isopropylmalate dehydratase large subunit [Leptospira sp. GIMC2001]WCL49620.1 3-isopropylmalate dehydratase large subunit [Leptospira sp. GIMC2001]
MKPKTLYDKIWDLKRITSDGEEDILYVDLHLVHEVTSPQAFEGIRNKNRKIRRRDRTFSIMDHNVSTQSRDINVAEPTSFAQMNLLKKNAKEFQIPLLEIDHPDQGIVHVVGPELGLTQPGNVIVCGDSHTSTHGAFGALAFGIGTSDIEHVFATQTIRMQKSKNMLVVLEGTVSQYISSKDIALYMIGEIGTAGGQGYVIEYTGSVIREMSMESRMTICNLSVEAGARAGLIAPDDKTFQYLFGRRNAPTEDKWNKKLEEWKKLISDPNAQYDKILKIDISKCKSMVTWGTNPSQVINLRQSIPNPDSFENIEQRMHARSALNYMDLSPGSYLKDYEINKVFIGSCTNSRIEDLRVVASIAKGRKVSPHVKAIIVPGSSSVRRQAEAEGLDKLFVDAGFEWRHPGCSMCLGMNDDQLEEGDRCASTSNRNFENRQGRNGRTHLVSPLVATISAILGKLGDMDSLNESESVV